ncbi:heavy metal translocating P-type ATPase [Planctomycetaceae bacterium SH139]
MTLANPECTPPQRLELRVVGMDCGEEIAQLKRELLPLVGDERRLGFDLMQGKLVFELTGLPVSSKEIVSAIARTGCRAERWQTGRWQTGRGQTGRGQTERWQTGRGQTGRRATGGESHRRVSPRVALTVISGFLTLCGAVLQVSLAPVLPGFAAAPQLTPQLNLLSGVVVACYLLAIAAGLFLVLPKAWRALLTLRPDMNLLMVVAVVGAVIIGEWLEGAMVAFLFALSLLLESWSVGRARRAIAELLDLSPPVAHLREAAGAIRDVPPAEVALASLVVIRPHEKIPLDGRVVKGISSVDQSPITGESMPVEKAVGEEVFAGTINGDGLLEIETTKLADATTLARIIQTVGSAQTKRAPAERWVERFAAVYTPIVMITALLIAVVPVLLFSAAWSDWLYRALVLLVIACPCALVISTPVTIVAALASAARNGVLIKGGVFVELPAGIRAIAIDKTGTLTRGVPDVVDLVPFGDEDEIGLLRIAAGLETHSHHPLARAIVATAQRRGIAVTVAEPFQVLPGQGTRGTIAGKSYWLGSARYAEQHAGETAALSEHADALQRAGKTTVVVGSGEQICGLIGLADQVREEAPEVMRRLRAAGVEWIVMLTGDSQQSASKRFSSF